MRILACAAPALLSACNARQSTLEPASREATQIGHLWWILFTVCGAVYVIVMATLLVAAFRSRAADPAGDTPSGSDPVRERRIARVVGGGVAATAVILFGFLIVSFLVGRDVNGMANGSALVIDVVGHQWWWEVQYEDSLPARRVTTANEVHIPVGRRVLLRLTSQDVNHSFWAPNLNGKRDLIPGHTTGLFLHAEKPGVYRGQCAEFCGFQHARMSFLVIAEPVDAFNSWLAGQRQEAVATSDSVSTRGQNVFLSSSCVMCHAIAGTPAGSHLGPDLTHLASRRTIAAGTLPNTRGYLAGWIVNAQGIKPGSKMPPNEIAAADLQALLDYLESLK